MPSRPRLPAPLAAARPQRRAGRPLAGPGIAEEGTAAAPCGAPAPVNAPRRQGTRAIAGRLPVNASPAVPLVVSHHDAVRRRPATDGEPRAPSFPAPGRTHRGSPRSVPLTDALTAGSPPRRSACCPRVPFRRPLLRCLARRNPLSHCQLQLGQPRWGNGAFPQLPRQCSRTPPSNRWALSCPPCLAGPSLRRDPAKSLRRSDQRHEEAASRGPRRRPTTPRSPDGPQPTLSAQDGGRKTWRFRC